MNDEQLKDAADICRALLHTEWKVEVELSEVRYIITDILQKGISGNYAGRISSLGPRCVIACWHELKPGSVINKFCR